MSVDYLELALAILEKAKYKSTNTLTIPVSDSTSPLSVACASAKSAVSAVTPIEAKSSPVPQPAVEMHQNPTDKSDRTSLAADTLADAAEVERLLSPAGPGWCVLTIGVLSSSTSGPLFLVIQRMAKNVKNAEAAVIGNIGLGARTAPVERRRRNEYTMRRKTKDAKNTVGTAILDDELVFGNLTGTLILAPW